MLRNTFFKTMLWKYLRDVTMQNTSLCLRKAQGFKYGIQLLEKGSTVTESKHTRPDHSEGRFSWRQKLWFPQELPRVTSKPNFGFAEIRYTS